jgi:hypothetical protein
LKSLVHFSLHKIASIDLMAGQKDTRVNGIWVQDTAPGLFQIQHLDTTIVYRTESRVAHTEKSQQPANASEKQWKQVTTERRKNNQKTVA